MIHTSAPAKLILFGEHSVVHEKPAIAAAVSLRTHCYCSASSSDFELLIQICSNKKLHFSCPLVTVEKKLHSINYSNDVEKSTLIDAISSIVFELYSLHDSGHFIYAFISMIFLSVSLCKGISSNTISNNKLIGVSIKTETSIPVGAGLGSSAAYHVALSAALLKFFGYFNPDQSTSLSSNKTSQTACDDFSNSQLELINYWAFQAEKIVHGNPSGVDNTVAVQGSGIYYKKTTSGPIISSLSIPSNLDILIVNTNVNRSTKTLVSFVGERKNLSPSIMNSVLEAMAQCVENFRSLFPEDNCLLSDSQLKQLFSIVDMNHYLLNAIGVGHESLDSIVNIALNHGFHGKLTGAGGGGCGFIILNTLATPSNVHIPPGFRTRLSDNPHSFSIEQMIGCLKRAGFECIKTSISSQGVSLEN